MRKTLSSTLRTLATISLALTLAAGAVGCSSKKDDDKTTETARHGLSAEQASEVLLKVGDTKITVGEFADRLADQSPYLRARYESPERRKEFLDNLVRFELMAAEAEKRGYMDLPEIQRARKQIMVQEMMKAEFQNKLQPSDITDEEVKAYYESNPGEFNKPEQIRASHIVVSNRGKAQRLLKQLQKAPTDARLFRQLALENNEDEATKAAGGDLRFFSKVEDRAEGDAAIPAPVVEAAFALKAVGDLAPEVIQTEQGFHIVKLTGRRAAMTRSLEQATRPVRNKLWREKREASIKAFIDKIREEAKVETHWDLLEQVDLNLAPSAAPGAEPGTDAAEAAPEAAATE